jgi:hypothetical protein
MRLGIIGSSHSTGRHNNPNSQHHWTTPESNSHYLAQPFENWFEGNGINIFNSAMPGKGTEHYLDNVIYLKKNHNIDTLLLEVVNNRSELNMKVRTNNYNKIYEETEINNVVQSVYHSGAGMYQHEAHLNTSFLEPLQFGTDKDLECWKRYQLGIAASMPMMEFWALVNIKQTVDLCKMLDIRVVAWSCRWNMQHLPVWDSVIKDIEYISFPDKQDAYNYYKNIYSDDKILCDVCHFNDATNKEMVNDFILPALLNKE